LHTLDLQCVHHIPLAQNNISIYFDITFIREIDMSCPRSNVNIIGKDDHDPFCSWTQADASNSTLVFCFFCAIVVVISPSPLPLSLSSVRLHIVPIPRLHRQSRDILSCKLSPPKGRPTPKSATSVALAVMIEYEEEDDDDDVSSSVLLRVPPSLPPFLPSLDSIMVQNLLETPASEEQYVLYCRYPLFFWERLSTIIRSNHLLKKFKVTDNNYGVSYHR